MYYLRPLAGPVPAEGPALCTVDERHEWSYGLTKHREAVGGVTSNIDQAKPHSYNQHTMAVQQNTRQFKKDLAKAMIGRENQKMVERLEGIARGKCGHGCDPRAPPPAASAGTLPRSAVKPHQASASQLAESRQRPDGKRRMKQHFIDKDNAGMVRRILATKPTKSLDSNQLLCAFDKHLRARSVLHKLPHDGAAPPPPPRSKSAPRTLPPLRPSRSDGPVALTGLQALFIPGDLRRANSGPATLALTAPLSLGGASDEAGEPNPDLAASATSDQLSPAGGEANDEPDRTTAGAEVDKPLRPTTDMVGTAPPEGGPAQGPNEPTWEKDQTETERRVWMSEKEQKEEPAEHSLEEGATELGDTLHPLKSETQEPPASAKSSEKPDPKLLTGMSESSVGYDDQWDQESMSNSTPSGGGLGKTGASELAQP